MHNVEKGFFLIIMSDDGVDERADRSCENGVNGPEGLSGAG